MITREFLKAEIDKVQDKYLGVLSRIIKSLVNPSPPVAPAPGVDSRLSSWPSFIEQTYGSLADDPIERIEDWELDIPQR